MSRALAVAIFLCALPARADLGKLDLAVTGGTPEAREHFRRGLLAMHSFFYDEATAEAEAAVKVDPSFAMGWWGLAMSHLEILWHRDDLPAAREALARIGAEDKLSPLERGLIGAARALTGAGNAHERRQAFAAALEKLHREQPAEDEVATLYAIALLASTPFDDPDAIAVRVRAAAIAGDVFQKNPQHPGAAHYIIHALDSAELAPLALPAARAYAAIAPDAFHARHMPAHIFSRLGMWKEALASCQSAWESSVGSAERAKRPASSRDFHSLHWIFEIDMELGRRKDAEATLARYGEAVRAGLTYTWRNLYTQLVESYLEQVGDFARADELLAPLAGPLVARAGAEHVHGAAPDLETPPEDLLDKRNVIEARLELAAGRHDVAAVKKLVAEDDAITAQVRPYREHQAGKEKYAEFERIRALINKEHLARARGDDKAFLDTARQLAAIFDRRPLGEAEIFAGGTHEDMAEALLRLKRPKEALAEYRLVLRKHAHYGRGLLGAARAASQAGDDAAARGHAAEAAEVWAGADDDFAPLAEARKLAGVAAAR
jgi:hypothetical protein